MAERRMFTKKITESDAFLDMPMSTQCLYFHLNMAADDDGFVNNPRRIQKLIGASEDDFNLLIAKSFVLIFDSGIIVIKHWKMHNYIQTDRYKPTDYIEEKSMLGLKKNKAYTLDEDAMYTKCIQNVSVGKDRLGKDRLGKVKYIVEYLNDATGKNFRPDTANTVKHINARLNDGYSVEDFKTVIDTKVKEWKGNDQMEKFLRPDTLFGSKFESYLNQGGKNNEQLVETSGLAEIEARYFSYK